MRIMVTGATGFVGRHVVGKLLECGHSVVAVARNVERAKSKAWYPHVEFLPCDLQDDFQVLFRNRAPPDALVHLAWPGLPNYRAFFQIGRNLPSDLTFLEAAVVAGVPQLVVAGTCLEYGMQGGPLTEDMATAPQTPYGFAKDSLRKSLQFLQLERPFILQWMRLFYSYGEGQNENSLLAHLDRAIARGDAVFNMSNGDQLRDYLPIEDVAANFALALENPQQCNGVVNCCSGHPVAVIDLVKKRCESRSSNIVLNRGQYPYPDYEPMAFWGVPEKLNSLRASRTPD